MYANSHSTSSRNHKTSESASTSSSSEQTTTNGTSSNTRQRTTPNTHSTSSNDYTPEEAEAVRKYVNILVNIYIFFFLK